MTPLYFDNEQPSPFMPFATDIPQHVATKPMSRGDRWWQDRFETLNALSKKTDAQLAFVGDSITQMWEAADSGRPVWRKYWAPLKAVNFGINGDRTEYVLWRLENGNLDGLNPKLIVLLIGTNNAGHQFQGDGYKCTAQQTADGIAAIVAKLKGKCPQSKILLLAILPRGNKYADPIRRQNEETNTIIAQLADNESVFFMDIGAAFVQPNGEGDATVMPDTLHLSTKGYEIWAEAILPTVEKLMQ